MEVPRIQSAPLAVRPGAHRALMDEGKAIRIAIAKAKE
jgi:hypothetical protein